MPYFQYTQSILDAFPTIRGGILSATLPQNGPSSPALQEQFRADQQATLQRIGETPLSDLPSIAAWRRVFSRFGVKPTQYRNAAEALLRRLTKQGDIPSINTLVDIGNLVSIRYALPVAVLDARALAGGITVAFSDGSERFVNLGADDADQPQVGEVIFLDETQVVHARRWCWRQSNQSAAQPGTTTILVAIEGHHSDAEADAQAALDDLRALLEQHGATNMETALLSPASPRFHPAGS